MGEVGCPISHKSGPWLCSHVQMGFGDSKMTIVGHHNSKKQGQLWNSHCYPEQQHWRFFFFLQQTGSFMELCRGVSKACVLWMVSAFLPSPVVTFFPHLSPHMLCFALHVSRGLAIFVAVMACQLLTPAPGFTCFEL